MELEFSGQIFGTYWNTEFYENPSSGLQNCSLRMDRRKDRHSDRHDEANSRFSQLCEKRMNSEFFVLIFSYNSSFRKSYHIEDINCNDIYIYIYIYIYYVCHILMFAIGNFWENWFTPIRVSCKVQTWTELKLLKPTSYVMHQQFNIQQLYFLPTLYLCVLYLSEKKQRLVPLIS